MKDFVDAFLNERGENSDFSHHYFEVSFIIVWFENTYHRCHYLVRQIFAFLYIHKKGKEQHKQIMYFFGHFSKWKPWINTFFSCWSNLISYITTKDGSKYSGTLSYESPDLITILDRSCHLITCFPLTCEQNYELPATCRNTATIWCNNDQYFVSDAFCSHFILVFSMEAFNVLW